MPRINLLPWRAAERKRRQQQFAVAAVAAVGAACAVTGLLYFMMSGSIDRQNQKNQLLTDEISQLDRQITQILELDKKKQRLVNRMEIIDKLQRSRPEVVHLFDQVVRTLPDGVYLTSFKQTGRSLEFRGITQSSTRVSEFMRQIDNSEYMNDPEVEIIQSKDKDAAQGSEFVLRADQVDVQQPAEPEVKK